MFPVMCTTLPYLPTLLCRFVASYTSSQKQNAIGKSQVWRNGNIIPPRHEFYASVTSYTSRPPEICFFTILHSAIVTINKNMDYCMNLIYSHLIIYRLTASCNVHFLSYLCYLHPSFCSLSTLLFIQIMRTKVHVIKKAANSVQVFSVILKGSNLVLNFCCDLHFRIWLGYFKMQNFTWICENFTWISEILRIILYHFLTEKRNLCPRSSQMSL